MGNALGKTKGVTVTSALVRADVTPGVPKFYTREKITPPFRVGGGGPVRRTDAQIAADAENRGLGGNFRQPVRELLVAMKRYR
jgi:hypothetical protein